jgi:transposase
MRVEVLGGLGRRRRWSQDDKARIVEVLLDSFSVATSPS